MKVAQILSTIPYALPNEYATQLAALQSNAPSMGWNFVKRRMAAELGENWESSFKEFNREATAAASLGQVHRAIDLGDNDLACKLQYPDMSSTVDADLRQLKLIFSIYQRYDKAIDPGKIHEELSARRREELDYKREKAHMYLYRHMLLNRPHTVFQQRCIDKLGPKIKNFHQFRCQLFKTPSFVGVNSQIRIVIAESFI